MCFGIVWSECRVTGVWKKFSRHSRSCFTVYSVYCLNNGRGNVFDARGRAFVRVDSSVCRVERQQQEPMFCVNK